MAQRARDPLNPRHEQLLTFIRAFFAEHGYMPSVREMADAQGSSTSHITYMLKKLQDDGSIIRYPKIERGITLVNSLQEHHPLRVHGPSSDAGASRLVTVDRLMEIIRDQDIAGDAVVYIERRPYCLCMEKARLVNQHEETVLCSHEMEVLDNDCMQREPIRELSPSHEDDGVALCFRVPGRIWNMGEQGWQYDRDPNTIPGKRIPQP